MSASKTTPPLTLIVAATVKNGIGKNGTLPWPMLKKEMAYFARVTKRVPSSSSDASQQQQQQNVVVMGRKTWDSIPPKFRPLPHRTNLVISRQDNISSISAEVLERGDVVVAKDIRSGLAELSSRAALGIPGGEDGEGKAGKAGVKGMGRVFVIGGGAIYKAALEMEEAKHILLTRIEGEWDCDTQFPVDLDGAEGKEEGWRKKETGELEGFVREEFGEGRGVLEEVSAGGDRVRYQFLLYERE